MVTFLWIAGGALLLWALYEVLPITRTYSIGPKFAAGVAVLGLIFVVAGTNLQNLQKPAFATTSAVARPKPAHDSVSAWSFCQKHVEDRLVSPSTAKYPWRATSEFVNDLGEGLYSLRNYVDSQNVFGAVVRANFFCRVRYSGGNWTLEQLEFN